MHFPYKRPIVYIVIFMIILSKPTEKQKYIFSLKIKDKMPWTTQLLGQPHLLNIETNFISTVSDSHPMSHS